MADPDIRLITVTRTPAGDYDTTWSLKPGIRVHVVIPYDSYTPEVLTLMRTTILPNRYRRLFHG